MATTTLGVKVDDTLRERLRLAASRLGCTPHWLHKQALFAYIDAIERGQIPAEIARFDNSAEEGAELPRTPEAAPPFYEFAQDVQPQSVLRAAITAAYRRPEAECLPILIDQARTTRPADVQALAHRLVSTMRGRRKSGGVENLIQEFSLSSQEGVALMCLAEALLRIPDRATRDALIRDKISRGDWRSHMGESSSLFVNAAAWGLMVTGRLVSVNSEQSLSRALTRMIGKGGEPLIRKGVNLAMRMMGEQFVCGQTISSALANSRKHEEKGFRYSYDMLGEAATTAADADRYYASYEQSIHAIGKAAQGRGIYEGPGISIKLSALHPRYARSQRDRVMAELLPRLRALAHLAHRYDIGLNIDAEEADRLELSLDLLEALCFDPELEGWNGIGFVVQAYQKRAPFVLDYLIDLAARSKHRLMVRLVKGAYWDTEIKRAQVDGLEGYPVFTRKIHTDVSYLACARKLLAAPQAVFPQFATHNAHTLSAIYYMAGQNYYPGQYEFQCLHGMGESLYEHVTGPVAQGGLNRPCRIYAPVGTHETLLAYLVRRLLENGANTSFVNQIGDEDIPVDTLIADPVQAAERIVPLGAPHDKIPLPRDLYAASEGRDNSAGIDLSNEHRLGSLAPALLSGASHAWRAMPRLAGREEVWDESQAKPVVNPADHRDIVGHVIEANEDDVRDALAAARHAAPIWAATPVSDRAACLRRTAQILEGDMQMLLGLIVREAGKSLPNAIAEVREAVDFLRYYAGRIERDFSNDTHRPLGPVLCISPWNFPLAIFTGQVSAALAAGNTVLAKPAEQTTLIAAAAVAAMHRAGIPNDAVQLLPGKGETVGAALVASPAVRGVLFTGSTEVAHLISRQLADRLDDAGHPIPLIAETGGLNAMIVDSSALAEQVVGDVLASAFDSAGQRCSALRLLCVQEDCADHLMAMLRGAMQELRVGNPDRLGTDVGPVIDAQACAAIQGHIQAMREAGHRVDQVSLDLECRHGAFVPPTLIEIKKAGDLKKEVFGPVLHVMRYRRSDLDRLVDAINASGYGLTFGVHTRLDETMARVSERIHAGNIYVNRNIVGAVVGVQPFGGEGLSGTGPKAGGPLYMLRMLSRQPAGMPGCLASGMPEKPVTLSGPTGESNLYNVAPRGIVLCIPATRAGAQAQYDACRLTGNRAALMRGKAADEFFERLDADARARIDLVDDAYVGQGDYQGVLFEGDGDALRELNRAVAARPGAIISVQGLSSDDLAIGMVYRPERLLREISISINTTAAGGNASLMMIG
ncbi:trifunctional transcriptional regulator/proline dehydrogenase/L-glutamate gamma-semialdehyde dehydrogenase [Allopusillimonas soli]|uniref:Bifunctional protein PutA n=1 Tax=Allopusillimonas soli TaxID=659016 RepID=A0A853FAV1_9BURK|nr:trifunctional transcriptional regulator/proline dehydrogenase/L-glutamate gamma-semialdehyde dehydrogenase [Allopusillimonas soli]NYT37059.1 trifunctional transcriptional regulator/proline dehydrogenase/L-glutamate gamma-semialdehyde dehydrogenase [Allopusillimonas soli]TEA75498.1 trifunctional transcriptional regulator/proline dehydrogenase/L-glutamate gamma-semialdehyde dehydrogenase [Allopusillimonas soli]